MDTLVISKSPRIKSGENMRRLANKKGMDSFQVEQILQLRILKELDLGESEVEDLSGHWLSHFPDSCTSLVSLNIACLASEVSFSALERLVARSPHLRTLRLNRAVSIEKLPKLLRHVSKFVEFGTGSYSADMQADVSEVFVNVSQAFSGSQCCNAGDNAIPLDV